MRSVLYFLFITKKGQGTFNFQNEAVSVRNKTVAMIRFCFPLLILFRYDIMYGVTQSESFHLLNAATLQFGRKLSL